MLNLELTLEEAQALFDLVSGQVENLEYDGDEYLDDDAKNELRLLKQVEVKFELLPKADPGKTS